MPEDDIETVDRDAEEAGIPQALPDTDPDDDLVTSTQDEWPYDPATESVPDEEVTR